jgi:excisionase family DNA binding protein
LKVAKAKQKKIGKLKKPAILVERGLKKLRSQELRERLSKSKKPIFIELDNVRFEIPVGQEQAQFLEALFEAAGLESVKKEGNVLTTQEVADLLNVSRPYVVKLIEGGQLKFFKVGSHRRVYELDAIEYRKKMRNVQGDALDKLAEETEKLGLEFK